MTRIVRLEAENFKRLRAVSITPEGNVIEVRGKNAQGKTSVLDAIWHALGGGSAKKSTPMPIREGESEARVSLDLGDLTVTRSWVGDKTTLVVESADGARYSSPQKILDDLLGRLSFDPLEFANAPAREQVSLLLDVVDLDLDLDALAEDRQRLYDERTAVGRQVKAFGDVPAVDPDAPDAEQSAGDLVTQIQQAQDHNRDVLQARDDVHYIADRITKLEDELAEARRSLTGRQAVAALDLHDLDRLQEALAGLEESNRRVRANAEARRRAEEKAGLEAEYEAHTKRIGELDEAKADALAAAEFPLDGLSFDEDGITYQGVPLAQASGAEKLRVSLAMAMALNPKLRVIRITDGSLLDSENMRLVADMAERHDFQVWVEVVSEDGSAGVLIDDGEVAS